MTLKTCVYRRRLMIDIWILLLILHKLCFSKQSSNDARTHKVKRTLILSRTKHCVLSLKLLLHLWFLLVLSKKTKSVCQSKRLTHSILCFVYKYKYTFFIHKQIYILCANSLLPFTSFMNYRQVIRTHWQTHSKKTGHSLHWKAGDSANAVPLTKKLRTRVIYIWDDRRGQPARSAMDRPRPRSTP